MKKLQSLQYESPLDHDVLEAYLLKNSHSSRARTRQIKRQLRKLAWSS
jgi:hypothetical protein